MPDFQEWAQDTEYRFKQKQERFDRMMCAGWGIVIGLAVGFLLRHVAQ